MHESKALIWYTNWHPVGAKYTHGKRFLEHGCRTTDTRLHNGIQTRGWRAQT